MEKILLILNKLNSHEINNKKYGIRTSQVKFLILRVMQSYTNDKRFIKNKNNRSYKSN